MELSLWELKFMLHTGLMHSQVHWAICTLKNGTLLIKAIRNILLTVCSFLSGLMLILDMQETIWMATIQH